MAKVYVFVVLASLGTVTAVAQVLPLPTHPPDGATDQPTTVTLRWVPVLLATSYDVQVSTTSDFRNVVRDIGGIGASSVEIRDLSEGTTYYWRVRAVITLVPTLWSSTSRFTTKRPVPQVPDTPSLSSPANGATGQPTTLTLSWNSSSGATSYELQVSSNASFSSLVVDQSGISSTSRQVSGLSQGTAYYWRVRARNSAGASGWPDAWSFSTQVSVPSVPALVAPPNGSTGQPTTLTLDWNSAPGAESYTLQVSSDNSFSSPIINQSGISGTSRQISGLSPGRAYYWRVSAQNSAGSGGWSDVWSFSTQVSVPSVPALVAPPNGSTGQPTTLTLDWSDVTGAERYHVQVSTAADFTSRFADVTSLTESSHSISGLSRATTYYWRVRAANAAGDGGWSEVWSFSTAAAAPAAPVLLSPPNGATEQLIPVTLAWSPVTGAESYALQVSTESSFTGTLHTDESSITETSREVSGLETGATYYWRVRAVNTAGTGPWSPGWSFTTAAPDTTPSYRLDTTIDFPSHQDLSQYSPADYKILGLPGASSRPLADFLPGSPGQDWQAYWDNGRETDYWVAYDGSPTFVFSVGRAFWILKRGPWTIDAVVPLPPTNTNGEVEIALHEGWNLVTGPYLNPVLWPRIQQRNSTSEPLYQYVNGRYGSSGYLEPYSGYYFFNDNDAPVLFIPPEDGSPGPPNREIAESSLSHDTDWRIEIAAFNGTITDELLWLGAEQNATAGKDAGDVHKPRPISGFGSYFARPEWDNQYSSFASDMRPPIETAERWAFSIESETGGQVQLSFSNLERVPADLTVLLIDEQSGEQVDVRTQNAYSFLGDRGVSQFSILIGKGDHVTGAAQLLSRPAAFAMHPNFPNPFNPSTTIPFELPEGSEVRIAIYDMLGRHIRLLTSGVFRTGRHRISWDGRNDNGDAVPSGVYFCKLDAGRETILSRPMILTK